MPTLISLYFEKQSYKKLLFPFEKVFLSSVCRIYPFLKNNICIIMSEYPFEGKIHSDDRINYKTVFSSDGIEIGNVEAAFAQSFIVRLEKDGKEIKYDIPRLEIATLINDEITLKLSETDLNQKYQTSSIDKPV